MTYRVNSKEVKKHVKLFMDGIFAQTILCEKDTKFLFADKIHVWYLDNKECGITVYKKDMPVIKHSINLGYYSDSESFGKAFVKALSKAITDKYEVKTKYLCWTKNGEGQMIIFEKGEVSNG